MHESVRNDQICYRSISCVHNITHKFRGISETSRIITLNMPSKHFNVYFFFIIPHTRFTPY